MGSGKSTLFESILKQVPYYEGSLAVNGTVAYCEQEQIIFAGSIRDNIIFGRPFDSKKYSSVVKSSALVEDLMLFDYGDETIVGDKGATLSGGQRARIGLARCFYQE